MQAYGQTTYLVTNFKKVPRGTEGAVSLEGTAAGAAAALLFAVIARLVKLVDGTGVVAITVAAIVANFIESFVGATVQGRVRWLTNDLVNALQISIAAVLAMVMQTALG